jgi:hypothetical protein
MKTKIEITGLGVNFLTLLFLVFLTLKLTNHIDWSWWLVFGPLWIPFAVLALLVFVLTALSLIALLVDILRKPRSRG